MIRGPGFSRMGQKDQLNTLSIGLRMRIGHATINRRRTIRDAHLRRRGAFRIRAMSAYSFVAVSLFYVNLALCLYVLLLDRRSRMHQVFFLMSLAAGLWNLLAGFIMPAGTRDVMLLWFHLAAIAGITFFPLTLHFVLALTGRSSKWWLLLLIYGPAIVAHYRNWTSFFMFDDIVRVGTSWVFQPAYASPWMYLWLVYSQGVIIIALVLLYRWSRQASSPRARTQARIVFTSLLLYLLTASIGDYLIAPRLQIPSVSPLLDFIFVVGTVYAVARYRFLSITSQTVSGDIIESLEVPILLLSPAAVILKANRAAALALGTEVHNAVGRGIVEFVGDPGMLHDGIRRLLRGTVEKVGCTLGLAREQSAGTLEVKLTTVKDDFGEVIGILFEGRAMSGLAPFLLRYQITPREWEVIGYVASGVGNRAIAASLFISERTVKNHLANVYNKLDVASRVGLVGILRDHNLFAVAPAPPGETTSASKSLRKS
jgi:DNA-binding CsgD family transcriptional regulator